MDIPAIYGYGGEAAFVLLSLDFLPLAIQGNDLLIYLGLLLPRLVSDVSMLHFVTSFPGIVLPSPTALVGAIEAVGF